MADFILAGDFRKGITFVMDGNKVMTIVDFLHVKPGKGAAFVRTKLRNVITGGVIEMTFNPTEKFPTAHIERKPMTYSYQDGDLYYFMDQETFDMIPLNKDAVEEALQFVPENGEVTTQGATKPATLETGYTLQVPLFVNEGDTIRVDTRTGTYMSRV